MNKPKKIRWWDSQKISLLGFKLKNRKKRFEEAWDNHLLTCYNAHGSQQTINRTMRLRK